MVKFALIGLIFISAAYAQIELFCAKTREHLYAFTKIYRLPPQLADKIAITAKTSFPLNILILNKTAASLNGYILGSDNQNMSLNVQIKNGTSTISLAPTTYKFKELCSISKYSSLNNIAEHKKYAKTAAQLFEQNTGLMPQRIRVLSKSILFANLKIPTESKAIAVEGGGAVLFAFAWEGELYDKNGVCIGKESPCMPVDFERVTDGYSKNRVHPILKYKRAHNGVDLAAKHGSSVFCVQNGQVSEIGYNPEIGNYVKIVHQNGFETIYGHLSKIRADLFEGKMVAKKELIGLVGQTGLATGPHLHFGVKKNGVYIEPSLFFENKEKRIDDLSFFAFARNARDKLIKNYN